MASPEDPRRVSVNVLKSSSLKHLEVIVVNLVFQIHFIYLQLLICSSNMGADHPDAQLYPNATGAAAAMVQAHQKEEPLKLYSGWVL
jgi:hypothetical protein